MGLEKLFSKKNNGNSKWAWLFLCVKLAQLAQKNWGTKRRVLQKPLSDVQFTSCFCICLLLLPIFLFPLLLVLQTEFPAVYLVGKQPLQHAPPNSAKGKVAKYDFPSNKQEMGGGMEKRIFSRFLRGGSSCLKMNLNKKLTSSALPLWLIWC